MKREGVIKALTFTGFPDGRFIFAAPTQQQAKDIFWDDLKAMVPDWALLGGDRKTAIQESSPQTIKLANGARIIVAGLDRPQRIEGSPIDWILLDEFADMKPMTFDESILPAISTLGRPGQVRFSGKPRGRNHYYELYQRLRLGELSDEDWAYHHWTSAELLPASQIAKLKRSMDPISFEQEIMASFVNFTGRAYYTYDDDINVFEIDYVPGEDLVFALDFNQSPGTATVMQEVNAPPALRAHARKKGITIPERITNILDEVYIPRGSNSRMVAQRLAEDWGPHKGEVHLYGDPAGGAKTSSSVHGSDWELVTEVLSPVYGDRLAEMWPRSHPPVRARINAVNTRIRTAGDEVSLFVSPRCRYTRTDFEGVVLKEGTGEIEKDKDGKLTHLSDGVGYYIAERWPIGGRGESFQV